jgi:class 3 adenylate cyclase
MATSPVKRKLAAILAADAVGYSRMMAADEEGTMKILSAHRSMIDGIIEFHEGRIINTAGDSVLAEFASPTQAVRCAVEIQDALKTRNDSLPEPRRMHFRIGVNLGDVMVKGDDLLGDGVNVAARLEGIAEPGMIYIASSVYDQIAGKLDLGFVDLGEQSLKNIDRPIRAYRVERDGQRARPARARTRRGAMPWITALAIVAAMAAGLAWHFAQRQAPQDAAAPPQAAPADTELAKARAEAEEARQAAASAVAAANTAKRELEEQRLAENRARAQAELAAARTEADAVRRKTQADLAAAAESRRTAEAAAQRAEAEAARRKAQEEQAAAARREAQRVAEAEAKAKAEAALRKREAAEPSPAAEARRTAVAPAAPWAAQIACDSHEGRPATRFTAAVTTAANEFTVKYGEAGVRDSLQLYGVRQSDGQMRLAGRGFSAWERSRAYFAQIDGRFTGERYEGRGHLDGHACALTIARP